MLEFRYLNGNYIVYNNGSDHLFKRALRYGEQFKADFPDSIDLKITNKCSWGCPWCHESSCSTGKSFDYDHTVKILSKLPKLPIEVAIGGGNILEIPKETLKLVEWLKARGLRPRATINVKDIISRKSWTKEEKSLIDSVEAWGISISNTKEVKAIMTGKKDHFCLFDENCLRFAKSSPFSGKRVVFHTIAGLFSPEDFINLYEISANPILILGYKQWGRAVTTPVPDMSKTKEAIQKILNESYNNFDIPKVLAFDNLALEQLDIKNMVSTSVWETLYMGEEGKHSMYIDAVNEEFARTSRSSSRTSWKDAELINYFRSL